MGCCFGYVLLFRVFGLRVGVVFCLSCLEKGCGKGGGADCVCVFLLLCLCC